MVADPRAALRVDRLRALNLPRPVLVEVDAQGRPASFRLRAPRHDLAAAGAALFPGDAERRVVSDVRETWRIDDEWWRVPIARQCYDVVLEGGGHTVLFQNLLTGEWFVQQP